MLGDGGTALQCPAARGAPLGNPVEGAPLCAAQIDDGGFGTAEIADWRSDIDFASALAGLLGVGVAAAIDLCVHPHGCDTQRGKYGPSFHLLPCSFRGQKIISTLRLFVRRCDTGPTGIGQSAP